MARYNLLEEAWIPVITDQSASTKKVSLFEIFNHADQYISLACDTKAQEFAVLRLLLAITQTVFSRFDAEGNVYEFLEVNEKCKQINKVVEDDANDYQEELRNTWKMIYESGKIPSIVNEYLEIWKDRFFLLDDRFPFYQVVENQISPEFISKANASSISGKNINRRISESGNKTALFSPKNAFKQNKEILNYDEIARWLITFQGYTGLSDKVMFGNEKYKASKGWLFDIGGIYLGGKNLFETLMLNTVLFDENNFYLNRQKPCWEYTPDEIITERLQFKQPDNLAELYTVWSRAVYIDPDIDVKKAFSMKIVKLPDIDHVDTFLEPMTIWRFNRSGENKDHYTPKKHPLNQSMWRSFGNIVLPDTLSNGIRMPGIIKWFNEISEEYESLKISVYAISMQDDGNATSWVPTDEIFDSLNIHEILLTDEQENGWVFHVTDIIEVTKKAVSMDFKGFLSDIRKIRNIESTAFVDQNIEELYFLIDRPFREWISSIEPEDSMDDKMIEWKKTLKNIIEKKAEEIYLQAGNRDYIGIKKDDQVFNIASAYSKFKYFLNITLKI